MINEDKTGFEHEANTTNDQDQGIGELPEALEQTDNQPDHEQEPPPDDDVILPPAVPLPVVEPEPTTQLKIPLPPEQPAPGKKADKKAKDKAPAKPSRNIMSVAVSSTEFEYLHKVFEARKASGLSNNWNHFLRQCLNYAVNWQKGWQFGVPKDIEKVYLD